MKIAQAATAAADDAPNLAESSRLAGHGLDGNDIEEAQPGSDAPVASWMQFFSQNEIDDAITESKKPVRKLTKEELKKEEALEQVEESDSEPSCDNYDEHELANRFDAAISEDEKPVLPKPEPPPQPPKSAKKPDSAAQGKDERVKTMQDDLDQMKKKNIKLSQRFDCLKEQINAKIRKDRIKQKAEAANNSFSGHQ